MDWTAVLICVAILIVAFLYSSVGHGGASGYLAVMALFSIAPSYLRSSALILNILVSAISLFHFYRQGFFRTSMFWLLVLGSIPAAFAGGFTPLPQSVFRMVLGVLLIVPAIRFAGFFNISKDEPMRTYSPYMLTIMGAVIGYLSGMTGIGGGILLSPLLLLLHWSTMKQTAALSAGFIFVNSISGIAGLATQGMQLAPELIWWLLSALAGGLIGGYAGAVTFNSNTLSRILGIVLLIASLKLIFTA